MSVSKMLGVVVVRVATRNDSGGKVWMLGLLGSVKVAKIPTEQSWSGVRPYLSMHQHCRIDYAVNALVILRQHSTALYSTLQHSAALCSTLLSSWIFLFHAFLQAAASTCCYLTRTAQRFH